MVKVKCKYCGAVGFKYYTHGKAGKLKGGIDHKEKCKNPAVKKQRQQEARKNGK